MSRLRLALGAGPGSIVRRCCVIPDAHGGRFGDGTAARLRYERLLREQFFGIGPSTFRQLRWRLFVLCAAATLAGYLPAMRASRVARGCVARGLIAPLCLCLSSQESLSRSSRCDSDPKRVTQNR